MATDDLGWLVAELEATRNELRRVRNRLDAVTEHSTDPVAMRDREGRYTFINAAGACFVGRTVAACLGRTDAEIFGAEAGAVVRERDIRVIETGKPEHFRYQAEFEGRERDVLVSKWPYRDENGRIAGVVLQSRDVSEVVGANREAAELAEGMRRLVESLPDVVLIHRDGVVLYANSAANLVLSQGRAVLEGEGVVSLFSPPVDLSALLASGASPRRANLEIYDSTAEKRYYSAVDVDTAWMGAPARALIARDVTEDRRAQAQLAATDRLAAVGMLASGVVHEVRNPLTFVTARLAELRANPEQTSLRDLDELADAARRMAEILQDVARFGESSRDDLVNTDVELALDRALNLARGRLHGSVEVERVRGGVPSVLGGERRLCQVFLNLIVNAAQAMEGRSPARLVVSSAKRAGFVEIRFRDTGPGVPLAIGQKVFDPFLTTKREGEGTGLGLWVSRGIVAEFGGRIELENAGESGACFVISLPFAADLRGPALSVSAPAAIDVQTVPVVAAQTLPTASVVAESRALPILLVVDDEPLIGDMLEMGLSREFMVELAGGVGPALERLRRSPTPDLVLCDMIMPGGGGPALIQALESEGGPLPPVVFMSGGAATSVAREFLRIRGIVPIEKPFRIQDVRQRLHAVFNRR